MPTYSYACRSCGKEVELVQKISEQKAPACDSEGCEQRTMDTLIQPSNFRLKGRGWARDGYQGGGKK